MIQLARRKRGLIAVSAVIGSVALVAALAMPSTGAVARPRATPGVTAHQIVLGATAPLTGPASPGYDQIAPATNAVFSYVNAHGGIHGRKIKYIVDNDQYDPTLTIQYTRQLVEDDNIFADVGSLGTPTQLAVQGMLNSEKVPQLFIESGCSCWSESKYPYSFGWQPNYIVEGKIEGQYIAKHFGKEKIGYLYQDDEFGFDGVRGLDEEIAKSSVVGRQTYQATTSGLAAGLGNQIGALKAAGAQVVVLYTIPAATALALLAAAQLNYHPQWVVSNVGADPPTVSGLLSSFSKGAAGASLMNGMISDGYLPPESDLSNGWVQLEKSILKRYDKAGYTGWDGNTEYGVALGFTVVELLQAAGKNLTRASLVRTLENKGSSFVASNYTPFTYSKSVHYGVSGVAMVKINNGLITRISPQYVAGNKSAIKVYSGKQKPIPALLEKG